MNSNRTATPPTLFLNDTFLDTIGAEPFAQPTSEPILGTVSYSIIILLSIIGNVIVVTAICRVQRLRQPTNFILMSLAIADLLVTTTVMVPGFIYKLKQKWIFGAAFCNVWVANDITFCTASILHLVAVSFDRFVAIENPLKYQQKMTKRMILVIIGCIWLISFLLSYGPVLLGVYSQSRSEAAASNSTDCEMRPNLIYSIISSSTSFYIPLIIILFLYGRIFITARKHSHELQKLENIIKRLHSDDKFVLESAKWKKNLKAIRTLGIVVGVFVACWLPFFVMYVCLPYCNYTCVSPSAQHYITWIGYANSFCNPVIYAFSNKEFRNGFFEILHYNNCHCYTLSSGSEVRTSISKSSHSMNTKCTVHSHSQQVSITPGSNQLQRNGCPPGEPTLTKWTLKANKSESTDTFEMQILNNQRPTLEAFTELENLVPNGVSGRASIVQMNSLLYDQENPPLGKSFVSDDLITQRSNHS